MATALHLPRSFSRHQSRRAQDASGKESYNASSLNISAPLPLHTPLPAMSDRMQNRQPPPRKARHSVKRNKISGPVQLLSTTNSLAYSSPDLKTIGMNMSVAPSTAPAAAEPGHGDASAAPALPPLNISAQQNGLDQHNPLPQKRLPSHSDGSTFSDALSHTRVSTETPMTSPSIASPIEPAEKLNMTWDYIAASQQHPRQYSSQQEQALRLSSHSKSNSHNSTSSQRSHQSSHSATAMATKAPSSVQKSASYRLASSEKALPAAAMQRAASTGASAVKSSNSSSKFSTSPVREHPFSRELAQVKEVAEEFGHTLSSPATQKKVWDPEEEADRQFLLKKGLKAFDASVYEMEVAELYTACYAPEPATAQAIAAPAGGDWL